MNMELREFLVKAKLSTYAGSGEGAERILKGGAKELTYEEGDFKYVDRYFGFNPFAGEEIVFRNEKAVWAMNYYGRVISRKVSAKKVYGFLKQALRLAGKDRPFRGPERFRKGDFEYLNEINGNIKEFSGIERIIHKGNEAYRLFYHGGRL